MKKIIISFILLQFVLLFLTACSTRAPRPPIKPNPIVASPELIEHVKSKDWLKVDCNASFVSMSRQDYLDCVLVQSALLKPFDPEKADHFGKSYDPEAYYNCRIKVKRNNMKCAELKLVRDEPKPVWPYPEVPAIKWPDPPEEQVYHFGITREDYFKGLCSKEAGRFVYKTVDNVEGVYQIRPQYPERSRQMKDPYVMEDPYGFSVSESFSPGYRLLGLGGYRYFETSSYDSYGDLSEGLLKEIYHPSFSKKNENKSMYFRYLGPYTGKLNTVSRIQVEKLKSRYGYVWRGITRPHDREMGIAGGELAIVDLKTNEILGLSRGFALTSMQPNGQTWWLGSVRCHGKSIAGHTDHFEFIRQVLKPVMDKDS